MTPLEQPSQLDLMAYSLELTEYSNKGAQTVVGLIKGEVGVGSSGKLKDTVVFTIQQDINKNCRKLCTQL